MFKSPAARPSNRTFGPLLKGWILTGKPAVPIVPSDETSETAEAWIVPPRMFPPAVRPTTPGAAKS